MVPASGHVEPSAQHWLRLALPVNWRAAPEGEAVPLRALILTGPSRTFVLGYTASLAAALTFFA